MQNVNEPEARDTSNGNSTAACVRAAEPLAALDPSCSEQGKEGKWERNRLLPLPCSAANAGRSAPGLRAALPCPPPLAPGLLAPHTPAHRATDLLRFFCSLEKSQCLCKHRAKLSKTILSPSWEREATCSGWLWNSQHPWEGPRQKGIRLLSRFWLRGVQTPCV